MTLMTGDDVVAVLAVLREAGVEVWVGGGWGIDALVGEQTRVHRDLDLMHRREQEALVVAALAASGFVESLDQRPVRFVVADGNGREIDLHPLAFRPDGSAEQASPDPDRSFEYPADCFVLGRIGGHDVACLSAEQQNRFHRGYQPTERDRHDMARLRAAFGIATHF